MSAAIFDKLLESMTDMDKVTPFIRAMLYGDPGNGKTVLAFKMAQALRGNGQILYVDTAQGFTTLRVNARWNHLLEGAVRLPLPVETGKKRLDALADALAQDERFKRFTVLLIDETTTFAQQDTVATSKSRGTASDRSDPHEITWPDRNISYQRVMDSINRLSNNDIHIIHLGHVTADKDPSNITVTRPSFGPKQVIPLLAPMQLVGYCKRDGQNYTVQVRSSKTVNAKTQFDQLGDTASHDDIVEAVKLFSSGNINEDLPPVVDTPEEIGIEVE